MSQQNQPELPLKIYSEVIVRSVSGESLLNSSEAVTSENVHRFYASVARLDLAAQKLRQAGFEVLDRGKVSITIAAAPAVYERSFQTTLEAVDRLVLKELGRGGITTFINAVDNRPFGEIDVSHTEWQSILDGVAINEPIYYLASLLPSATPPITTEDYLSVPEGVAQGLNATLAHQQGVTGKGVKVVMVDSGWYRHPFFSKHNYQVDVRLCPGSSNENQDDIGHGTGESANLLAIAPEVSFTMVKADMTLDGKVRNVNSISALRTAISLRPNIISCSWGTDQRNSILSPYSRLLAATIAEAVEEGIIVIFSAGNGHYGFPAQHPEVIAAGGVYQYLNGSLKGKLEASNYASSFISPVYPERRVPDVCGLVGKRPHGSYIMLPIPPDCIADQALALLKDGTEPTDGWAAFSGTSAAAPQLAGICALMKQINPDLSPIQVKQILQQTARDVVDGFSNPNSGGAPAAVGIDLATGYGLVDANAAVNAAKILNNKSCCDNCASSVQSFSESKLTPLNSTPNRRKSMSSQFPKLQKKLDELLWKFEQELQEASEKYGLEDVELRISEANFIDRSPITKVAYSLRQTLDSCFDLATGKVSPNKITKEHIPAAQGLLKIGRYQETAIQVLTQALLIPEGHSHYMDIKKLASQTLSECGSEIIAFDKSRQNKILDFFDGSLGNDCFVYKGKTYCPIN